MVEINNTKNLSNSLTLMEMSLKIYKIDINLKKQKEKIQEKNYFYVIKQ